MYHRSVKPEKIFEERNQPMEKSCVDGNRLAVENLVAVDIDNGISVGVNKLCGNGCALACRGNIRSCARADFLAVGIPAYQDVFGHIGYICGEPERFAVVDFFCARVVSDSENGGTQLSTLVLVFDNAATPP